MGDALVIVESPAKAKTIAGYLGDGFVVESSIGHVRDLAKASQLPEEFRKESWASTGVNVNDNFFGFYVVDPEKNDDHTNAIRSLNRHLLKDDRVVLSMLPVGDGLTLVMKKRP